MFSQRCCGILFIVKNEWKDLLVPSDGYIMVRFFPINVRNTLNDLYVKRRASILHNKIKEMLWENIYFPACEASDTYYRLCGYLDEFLIFQ